MSASITEAEVMGASDRATLMVPPHSLEAEQSVIGALLLDNAAFDRIGDIVKADDFYRFEHREIFAAMVALNLAGKPADVVTVFEAMRKRGKEEASGGMAYLNAMAQSVPAASNARRYAEIVREKAVQRELIACARDAETIAWGNLPLAEKVDEIGQLFAGIQRQQMRKAPRALSELMMRAVDRYSDLAEGKATEVWRTGIAPLDRLLGGGLRPGKVYGLAARPSVGKSSAARAIGVSTAIDGHPTLLLSQEMPDDEVADCIVAQIGRIDSEHLQTGELDDFEWSQLSEAVDIGSKLPFHVDDDGGLTLADIRGKARLIKGLRVLILDYLQLSTSTLKNATTNDQIAEISKGLKALALQLRIAIVVLSQLNRDVEKRADKEPQLADLRDSGAIEQDIDVAVLLWTFKEYDDGARRIVGWKVAKHRGGRKGRFAMEFDAPRYLWTESAVSLDPPAGAKRGPATKGFDE